MPIQDDAALAVAVEEAGRLIQEISDYANAHPEAAQQARLRFPTGFLRTASEARKMLQFVPDERLRKNLSYAYMTHDVLRWLLSRTTISGQAREMVIKEGVCLVGSICESLTIWPGEEGLGKKKSFTDRVARLRELEVLSEQVETDLNWVWEIRCREHIAGVALQEWNHYSIEHWRRSVGAWMSLRKGLSKWKAP